MSEENPISEGENQESVPDPDETPIRDRKLVTQPYDLVIGSLVDQIKGGTLHLRPISERPRFQRRYIWPDKLASRLIESILLSVPIPPCYLSQNEDFELDVIDGQQRIFSIYRFIENQLTLSELEVLVEHNGNRFFELPRKEQLKIKTHTLRCVVITNDSHPEIKFDVFERLNTNTIPLNAQELRNCMFRGTLNNLLGELAGYGPWLKIIRRKEPDKRMRDEELILRFFAFYINGVDSYRTPQKHWLNDVAKAGRKYPEERINELASVWRSTIDNCLLVFASHECFRRLPLESGSKVINRALMDLTMNSLIGIRPEVVQKIAKEFYKRYKKLMQDDEFLDLISKSVDHKSRTNRRFEIWREKVSDGLI